MHSTSRLLAVFGIAIAVLMPGKPAVAQYDCTAARQLYEQAHQAQAAQQYQYVLQLLEAVRSSVPRYCRLESDGDLDRYEANLRNLIAQQGMGGGARPCRPAQTGPTSYSCL